MIYFAEKAGHNIKADIDLNSSKSESNRVLIIQALTQQNFKINNLSESDDTNTLIELLNSDNQTLDAGPAGTTLRFLISYLAVKKDISKTLTGSARMLERPVKELVEALKELGADIEYLEKDGYPPLKITGKDLTADQINISGNISSQYITSLMLIAPTLEKGLKISIEGKIASKPYINMTLKLLNYFGVNAFWQNKTIIIPAEKYHPKDYTIEGDWSSASYLYQTLAFAKSGEINIKGLKKDSLQGDSVIAKIMERFGIETIYSENSIKIIKNDYKANYFEYDFSDCPDIAQTIAVTCAGLGIKAKLTGLESLKIKETNRVQALINEISKLEIEIKETEENVLEINPKQGIIRENILINTYKDHRMAMAFAPLSMICNNIRIEEPSVVKKSYPDYWNDLNKCQIKVEEI